MTRPLALAIALVMTVAGRASARPRVALPSFAHDPGGKIHDAVTDALEDAFSIASRREVSREVDKLGLRGRFSKDDLDKLARELDVDAVIQGEVSTHHHHHVVHFRLFVHGKLIRGFRIEFGSLESKKVRKALRDKMVEKIADASDRGDDERRDDHGDGDADRHRDDDREARHDDDRGGHGDDHHDDRDARRDDAHRDDRHDEDRHADGDHHDDGGDRHDDREARGDDGDHHEDRDRHDDGDHHDDGDRDDRHHGDRERTASADDGDAGDRITAHVDRPGHASSHTANRVAIRVDFGGSAQSRKLTFVSRSFTEGQGPPPGYHNKLAGGGRVDGELYPFAFGNPDGAAAGFGFAGSYDQTVGLSVTNSAQQGMKFPVTSRRWMIGARYRLLFGHSATSPTLTITADYGHRTFKINRAGLMEGLVIDVPDVDYAAFAPGLQFRIPLARSVALVFGGDTLLMRKTGGIQRNSQYGPARVTAGEGMVGIDFTIKDRFGLRIQGEAAQIGFAFTGKGELANDRDGDPASPDVGGASDRYIGGSLTFGVLY